MALCYIRVSVKGVYFANPVSRKVGELFRLFTPYRRYRGGSSTAVGFCRRLLPGQRAGTGWGGYRKGMGILVQPMGLG